MYLHLGNGVSINGNDVIAILNLKDIKETKEYKEFYRKLLEENCVVDISNGNEKSFILTTKQNQLKAYISNIGSNTIGKRKG